MPLHSPTSPLQASDDTSTRPLGTAPKGFKGIIQTVDASACATANLSAEELEQRLAEMGFIKGSIVEIRHEGFWGRDPIAVKVNHMTVALRRQVANAIHVLPL